MSHLQFGVFPLIRLPHCDVENSRNGGLPSYGNWFLIPESGYVVSVQKRSESYCDAETAEVAIMVPTEDGYLQYKPKPKGVDEVIPGGGILSYQSPQDILKLIVKLTRMPPLPHLDKIAKGYYPVIKQTLLPKHLVKRIHQRNRKLRLIKTPMTLRVFNYGSIARSCPSFAP